MIRPILPWVFLSLLGCAATSTDVSTQFDRNLDFTKYKSFAFVPGKVVEKPGYVTIDKTKLEDRFRAAVRDELEKRGFVYVTDSPDLYVTFTAGAQRREDLVQVAPTAAWAGPGPEGWDVPGAWRPEGWYSDADDEFWTRHYTEGTLLLDMVDAKTRKPAWRAYSVVQILRDDPPKTLMADTVAKALKDFPPGK